MHLLAWYFKCTPFTLLYFVFYTLYLTGIVCSACHVKKLGLLITLILYCRHPTSCASAAEIMAVLFFNTMKYSTQFPRDPASDRFVMSKVSLKL